jgi:Bacterial transcriptional activator domain
MRVGRAFLATAVLVGVTACGSGSATVFQSTGCLSPAPVRVPLPDQAGQRLAGFRFPSEVSIGFTTPGTAAPARRAVIDDHRNYVLTLWAAVPSHGKHSACQRQAVGSVLAFVRREVARYGTHGATAAAGLLAVGVLVALERRRRRQARRRLPGRRVVAAPTDAAQAELALRLGEDEASERLLDTGLCYLGHALRQQGRMPPTVFAVHVGADNLDLWVDPPDHDVPRPWYAVGDGQVWRLPLAAAPRLAPEQPGPGPALYPGLVTIGTDATGRVLVDLEAARGLIAVTGPDELVAEALAGMAAELATSRHVDAMRLTLVGVGKGIEVLAPGRVEAVCSMTEALPLVAAHIGGVSDALAASGARSALAGRAEEPAPEAWRPHYLVALIPPTQQEARRLAALARSGRQGAGYLVAGQVPGATWTWEVTPDGRLRAPELGLDVTAQLIPREQPEAAAGLFDAPDDVAGARMPAPPVAVAAPLDATAPAEVTLLGPVRVRALGDIEASLVPLATEIVVYLAAHPGGAYPNALAQAIWPQGVAEEIRDGVLAAVAGWLGADGLGRPHLAADASGRLRLGAGVKVDWHVFLTLVAQAAGAAGGKSGPTREEAKLAQALSLVTGQFLAGIGSADYAWVVAGRLECEVSARVADAAHRLCELRLAAGDPRGAMDAVRTGLRMAPDDELLWRDLLTAAQATGQENLVYAAVGEVWAQACPDGPPPRLAPETEALLDEVLPTWRWTLA